MSLYRLPSSATVLTAATPVPAAAAVVVPSAVDQQDPPTIAATTTTAPIATHRPFFLPPLCGGSAGTGPACPAARTAAVA